MHSHHEDEHVDIDMLRKLGYEERDVDLKKITRSVVIFMIFTTASVVVTLGIYFLMVPARFSGIPEPVNTFSNPTPTLQTNSTAKKDIRTLRAQEEAMMTSYWRKDGTLHIPIDEAMKLALARGFGKSEPTTTIPAATGAETGNTSRTDKAPDSMPSDPHAATSTPAGPTGPGPKTRDPLAAEPKTFSDQEGGGR